MKHKKLYIFDWDGTVMDSISQIVASMQAAAKRFNLALTDEAAKDIIGLGLPEAISTLFPNHPEHWQGIRNEYATDYVANSKNALLYDGINELIKTLHEQGNHLAVATGKSRKGLDRVLDESNLRPYFISSRGADETKSKPNPLMLTEILKETKVAVADAVMIGDTSYDMEMAQNINMDRIAVTYGTHSVDVLHQYTPNHLAHNVSELAELLLN